MRDLNRRGLIGLVGGAATWPLAARAQQPVMPVIGFLDTRSSDGMTSRLASFRQGLKEVGIVEGENVMVIYRWAEDRVERLPDMARELAQQATVIVTTGGPPSALAAKEATRKPVVFLVGDDPVRLGLVSSLARPGGNHTGSNMLANELEAKRFQFLHQLVPQARRIGVLVNPASASNMERTLRDIEPAARTMGLQLLVFKANTAREIEDGFAWSERDKPDAL